jgi:hypothetical protein
VPKYLQTLNIDSVIFDIGNPVQISTDHSIYIFKKDDYRMRIWASENRIDTANTFPIEVWKGNPADIMDEEDLTILKDIIGADSLTKFWFIQQKYDINGGHLSEIGIRRREVDDK